MVNLLFLEIPNRIYMIEISIQMEISVLESLVENGIAN